MQDSFLTREQKDNQPLHNRKKSGIGALFASLSRFLKSINRLNFTACVLVIVSFILLFGFHTPPVNPEYLHTFHFFAFVYFVAEKFYRFLRSESRIAYIRENWLEIPMLLMLVLVSLFTEKLAPNFQPQRVIGTALGAYLIVQVVDKLCRFIVSYAATGRNPMRLLVVSFLVLILGGAGFLMLPTFHNTDGFAFVDACFTTTSAVCVTGLIVVDTATDFTLYGQIVILILIQLGGLGIVIFGAIIAQLFGKAFSLSESVAMQDLLSADTVSRIGRMIGFVFTFTIIIEAIGALALYNMWDKAGGLDLSIGGKIYYSIFHSVSAFCNAGFALFDDSFTRYARSTQIYAVICPLIVIGGLGFGVLYNLSNLFVDKIRIMFYKITHPSAVMLKTQPKRLRLQSKIAIIATATLLIGGTIGFMVLMKNHPGNSTIGKDGSWNRFLDAFFLSVTSRTAGFNTVDTALLSGASKLWTIVLMCIGGSPGSTAGGIKTVTLVVLIMTVWTTITGRREVEVFKRSIRYVIIGRAVTVIMFYITALLTAIFALCITERASSFTMMDIVFEAASAMGTVGLSTGITSSLSDAGKLVITAAMLTGRLGPLTLLASVMFKARQTKYSYADEPVVVG